MKNENKVRPYAWVILIVGFIASVAAPLCMFKVSTILPTLIEKYNLSLTIAGLMVSIFSLTGFILALPASSIFQKLGLKWTCVVSMAFLVVGSLMGTFAATGAALLVSRFIEGAGMGLISVAVPAGLSMWFPAERRGIAIGIWNNWMTIGSILAFSIVPILVAHGTYKSAMWFSTIYAAVALILCLIFMRMPKAGESLAETEDKEAQPAIQEKVTLGKALSHRNIWFAMIVALCFGVSANILPTYYPTVMPAAGILSASGAAQVLSIQNVFGVGWGLVAGFILDRLSNRKLMFSWTMIALAVLFIFPFRLTHVFLIYGWMFVSGFFAASIPASLFATVPEIMSRPGEASYGMGMLTMGQNFGMFIGAPIIGRIADGSNWAFASACVTPVLIIGAIFGFIVILPKRKKQVGLSDKA